MPDNVYRQVIVTRMHITRVELVTLSTIVVTGSILHKSTADFFAFWKYPPQICESCGAPTHGRTKRLVRCKEHPAPSRRRKQRQNRSIIGDAFLHQTGKKMTEK